jgi:hypothetical protein
VSSRQLSVSLHISRAERVSSFSFLRRALSVCMHAHQELSVCVHVSARMRAERVSLFICLHQEWCVCVRARACVCTYQELIVYLRAFARFESRTCCSMCLHTLRAESEDCDHHNSAVLESIC